LIGPFFSFFFRQSGQDVSTKLAQLLKTWNLKEQDWNKAGLGEAREEYERIQKEVDASEDFSLDRASKLDIIIETSDSTLKLAEQAQTFQSHQKYINSDAVGSTFWIFSFKSIPLRP
jgi:hypothetical protein